MTASCTHDEERIERAAATRGVAAARVTIAALPDDCRRKEAHAALVAGAVVHSVLIRERDALDRQNERADRCAAFYDEQKAGLE